MAESAESWYEAYARDRVAGMRTATDARAFALSYNLLQLSQMLVNDLEARVHRQRRLTLAGFRLMFKLWLMGPTQPARLAEISVLTRSAVSNLVNTLERDGFVRRTRSDSDRRVVFVELTAEGQAAVAEVFELQLQRERAWFAGIDTTGQEQAIALLRTLIGSRPQD